MTEGKIFRDPDLDLNVVGHGVDAGDLVLGAPADEGLVARQPHEGLGSVDPGAQESGDGRGVAWAGEVQQRGLGSGVGVILLLVVAVAGAAGADDPALFVALDVHFALVLAAGQGAGGELFDHALVVGAQALEDGYERAEAGAGDHVGRVFAGLQEDGHDDASGLGGAVLVEPECAADVLDDLDL